MFEKVMLCSLKISKYENVNFAYLDIVRFLVKILLLRVPPSYNKTGNDKQEKENDNSSTQATRYEDIKRDATK